MRWSKLGQVFCPSNNYEWMVSHAAVPIAEHLYDSIIRVYFGSRDKSNRASIGYLDLDLNTYSFSIRRISNEPVLSIGELGTFDDSGVLPSWLVKAGGRKYLYYIGWNLGVTVPFRNFCGLAISEHDEGAMLRISRAPIMDRDQIDPFFFTNPCILVEDDKWKMWYLSCTKWVLENGKPKHFYHIKYAESLDGIRWRREGIVCIDFQYENEFAISRPCVIKEANLYKMWYSHRGSPVGETYRIGYAESKDGIHWERNDEKVGIDISDSGWDSDMIEYPFVFDHQGQKYMLYNGNGFGKTGFGLAVLEQE